MQRYAISIIDKCNIINIEFDCAKEMITWNTRRLCLNLWKESLLWKKRSPSLKGTL